MLLTAGCGGRLTETGASEARCEVGVTQACLGPGRCPGARACLPDGTGYEECDCGALPPGGSGSGAEVDECAANSDDCSSVPDACVNRNADEGGYACQCPSGYVGSAVGEGSCVDIDECATDNGGCGNVGDYSCTNNDGALPTCARACSPGTVAVPDGSRCIAKLIQLSAGRSHTFGLRNDGSIACLGDDRDGSVSGPNADGGTDFTQITTGREHTCGLRGDGSVTCWGGDQSGSVDGPNAYGGAEFTQITAHWFQTCGVHEDGSATCRGYDHGGSVNGPNSKW